MCVFCRFKPFKKFMDWLDMQTEITRGIIKSFIILLTYICCVAIRIRFL